MPYDNIQDILNRYWEGETSLEEERILRQYFNSGQIDERLKSDAPFFQALAQEKAIQLTPKKKGTALRPQLYQWAAAASFALICGLAWWMWPATEVQNPITQTPTNRPEPNTPTPAVLDKSAPEMPQELTPPMAQNKPKKRQKRMKTHQKSTQPAIDEETAQAMAEIKAALALVSAKLDKGKSQAIKGAAYLESVEKVPKRKEG